MKTGCRRVRRLKEIFRRCSNVLKSDIFLTHRGPSVYMSEKFVWIFINRFLQTGRSSPGGIKQESFP
jgi:hypothetical protein